MITQKKGDEIDGATTAVRKYLLAAIDVMEAQGDAAEKLGGIDLNKIDVKTDASSALVEFKGFDPAGFRGFGFMVAKISKMQHEEILSFYSLGAPQV
jgi:hypothetical protein